jgi:hypothetical protein
VTGRLELCPGVYRVRVPDGLYFLGHTTAVRLTGASIADWVERLAPHLDGRNTLAELTAGQSRQRAAMVERVVASLREAGVVREVSGPPGGRGGPVTPPRPAIRHAADGRLRRPQVNHESLALMLKVLAEAVLLFGLAFATTSNPPPDGALWNAERTAAVAAVPDASGTRVTAYLQQPDGTFLEIDLSAVERRNLGKLGRLGAEYDHVETRPIEWLPRQDGLLQVKIQTQAWRAGQRYTVSEPLVLRPDGTVIWR